MILIAYICIQCFVPLIIDTEMDLPSIVDLKPYRMSKKEVLKLILLTIVFYLLVGFVNGFWPFMVNATDVRGQLIFTEEVIYYLSKYGTVFESNFSIWTLLGIEIKSFWGILGTVLIVLVLTCIWYSCYLDLTKIDLDAQASANNDYAKRQNASMEKDYEYQYHIRESKDSPNTYTISSSVVDKTNYYSTGNTGGGLFFTVIFLMLIPVTFFPILMGIIHTIILVFAYLKHKKEFKA